MTGLSPAEWRRLAESPLYLDQTEAKIEVDQKDVELFYLPLAESILKQVDPKSRLMVCVAGPPGSGKTIFATLLVSVINLLKKQDYAVYVGLDGWHYPNTYLDTHTILIGGELIPLRKIKGAPETFDSKAALSCLQRIRQGESVRFPIYSRELHDPIKDKGSVEPFHQVVVIEGNYLLLDEDPWKLFFPLFDICIFLEIETSRLLDGLRERHRRGGKNTDLIAHHMLSVDLPNIVRVKSGVNNAQVIVHKADNRRITSIEWKK